MNAMNVIDNQSEPACPELLPSFSVVIPVYNEEANLPVLIPRTLAACRAIGAAFELILVDDGSRDSSAAILREASVQSPEVIAVCLNRNYGQHNAIFAGFAQARGTLIINLDADLQNPPEEIHKIYGKLCEGFDVVAGRRIQREDSVFRTIPSSFVNYLIRRSTGIHMHDYGCMLRGYHNTVVKAMLSCRERTPFIPVLANSFASRTCEVEVAHETRHSGDSRYSFRKLISLHFDMLTGMTTTPLRLLSIFGLGVFVLGSMLSAYIIVMRILHGDHWTGEGVFTLFAVLYFFVGAQFLGMGLMGEYIGRMFKNVEGRPRYLVKQTFGKTPIV